MWKPSGEVVNLPLPLPGKVTLDDEPVDVKNTKTPAELEVFPRKADGEPSHDKRFLHASDLLPGTLGTDTSFPTAQQRQQKQQQQQQHAKPRVIHVEEKNSQLSETSLQNTYSVEERRQGLLHWLMITERKERKTFSRANKMDEALREKVTGMLNLTASTAN